MSTDDYLLPELLWDSVLSREPARILAAWNSLNSEARTSLEAHLERMAGEPGWHPDQVISAQAALQVIRQQSSGRSHGSQ